jgi:hypothetical protein
LQGPTWAADAGPVLASSARAYLWWLDGRADQVIEHLDAIGGLMPIRRFSRRYRRRGLGWPRSRPRRRSGDLRASARAMGARTDRWDLRYTILSRRRAAIASAS